MASARLRRGAGAAAAALLVAAGGGRAAAADTGAAARPARVANYRIAATYDRGSQTVTGHETLRWHNTTRTQADSLCFHLYLNAFANNRSTFMRGVGPRWVEWFERHPHAWGSVEAQAIRIGAADLTARQQFIHPDDDNADDRTVMLLPLDTPVPAGGSVDVEIDFVARLPKIFSRTGHAGPFVFVAQWFPKLGVYEAGAWNCHQYHVTTEFFSDFGEYDVTLTVPRDGIVGATGVLRAERDNGDGSKTLRFVAADVHDFAWTLDPRFHVVEEVIDGIAVRLLLQPQHRRQAARHLRALRAATTWYRKWIGPYPYPQLTVVDPGPGGGRAGGMEYPTLMTTGTAWWMPAGLRLPELLVVHEFGHQYWHGMVASNEPEEAWLDEGINSYVEGRIMDATFGPGSYVDTLGVQADSIALARLQYLTAAQHDPIARPAWQFLDRTSYAAVSYAKTALALATLEGQLGTDVLRAGLAHYFDRWRFRHPRRGDFVASLADVAGDDLSWFLDPVLSGTGLLDYAVTRVDAWEAEAFAGYPFDGGRVGEEVPLTDAAPPQGGAASYRNEVVVERLGTVQMPVDVLVVFEDGACAVERWDGRDRWKRFTYGGTQRVEWAVVDPQERLALEANRTNNSRLRAAGVGGIVRLAGRWGLWFQSLLFFLTGV